MKQLRLNVPIELTSTSDLGVIKLSHETSGHDPLIDLVFMHEDDINDVFIGSFVFDEPGIWTLSFGDRSLKVNVSNSSKSTSITIE